MGVGGRWREGVGETAGGGWETAGGGGEETWGMRGGNTGPTNNYAHWCYRWV